MSKYDLPDLPSDEELGITDEDREAFEKEFGDERPEMSDAELAALLGGPSGPAAKPPKGAGSGPTSAASGDATGRPDARRGRREQKKAAKAEEKKRARAEKERARAEKKRARAAKTAARAARTAGEEPTASADEGASPEASAMPAPDGSGDGEVRSRWRGPVTFVLLVGISAVASIRTGLPRPGPANLPDTAFSSSRAMATLVELTREPRPTGSPEHARVRADLLGRLRSLGFEAHVQTTTSVLPQPGRLRSATVRNIVARLRGSDPSGSVLLTAHYDSREISVGAADNGSGVVTILEALRALRAGGDVRNDLIVLLTDAEELGMLGARAFVAEHEWMPDVDLVLAFEARGSAGPSIMFETNADNGWVVRAMKAFDSHPFANSLAREVYPRMPNRTDFTPFVEAGVQGLNFAVIDDVHVYHQEYDTPERMSEATLQHHGIHALGALRHFGDVDLGDVDDPDLVYFTVPGVGLLVYDPLWVLPLSGLIIVLYGLLVLTGGRSGARTGAAIVGLVALVAVAGAGYAIGTGGLEWLTRRHDEAGALYASLYHSEGWYVLALAFVMLAWVTTVTSVARRWVSATELALGAVVVPVVAAIALSVVAPLGAMNLQWPVLAGLLAMIAATLLGTRSDGVVGWLTSLLLAAPVVLMLLPLVEQVWLTLTLELAGALAVMMALGLFLCLPALGSLRHPNPWWAPVTSFALSGACLGVGLLLARASESRPAPTTLVYAYEHGSGAALWATAPLRDALGDEARAWAVERAGGAFDDEQDLGAYGYVSGPVPVTPAPIVDAARPSVAILTDTTVGGQRRVSLGVRSNIGAERLGFRLEGGTRLRSINGVQLEGSDSIFEADHWGDPVRDVVLELTLPATEPIGVEVVEHLLRPEELLGHDAFVRPPTMAANVNRLSDRAMFRYSIGILGETGRAPERPPEGTTDLDVGDPLTIEPDTGAAGPDTSAVDTLEAVPGTVRRDTVAVGADSVALDSVGTAADSLRRDTVTVSPDSLRRDTVSVSPDSVRRDTLAGTPDSVRRDTSGAAAVDTAAVSDTLSVRPDTLTTQR